MAIEFHKLKVKKIKRETSDTVSISFALPDDKKDKFKYKPGQYLTVKCDLGGSDERRAYSISSSPDVDTDVSVTVKEAGSGKVSKFLNNELKEGDFLDVMPPLGNFTIELDSKFKRTFVMFGGGSGITPLISIIKSTLIKEPATSVHLFYASRSENSIIFKDDIEALISQYPDKLKVVHIISRPGSSWNGLSGYINQERTKQLLGDYIPNEINKADYFLCGVAEMMRNVEEVLSNFGVSKSQIHKESFTIGIPKEINVPVVEDESNDQKIVTRTVKIMLYAEEHELTVKPDETVVTAALRQGIDPPFSCQIGACSTCRAKLLSGKVHMDERESLTDEEIAQGYILSCQSHPLTENVYIDYDV